MNDSRKFRHDGQFYICDDCAGDEWTTECGCYFLTEEHQASKSLESALLQFGRKVFSDAELVKQIAGSEIGWMIEWVQDKKDFYAEQSGKAAHVWQQIEDDRIEWQSERGW